MHMSMYLLHPVNMQSLICLRFLKQGNVRFDELLPHEDAENSLITQLNDQYKLYFKNDFRSVMRTKL